MHLASQNILVTGGTGFIGKNLLIKLIENGFRPNVFCRNAERLLLEPEAQAKVSVREFDLLDFERLEKEVLEIRPQIVVHLAGATRFDPASADQSFDINFTATVRLLDALAQTDVRRVVLIGTADEYGNLPTPFREEMPANPLSQYAVSRNKANSHALQLFETAGLPIVILRLFTVYGYSQPKNMFLGQLIESCLRGERFEMTDGLQKRDYIHISDAVEAIYQSMRFPGIEGRVINIGGGNSIRLRDVAEKVWEICGAEKSLLQIGKRYKPINESFDTEADIGLAKKLLEWEPKIDFETGLREMIFQTKRELSATKRA